MDCHPPGWPGCLRGSLRLWGSGGPLLFLFFFFLLFLAHRGGCTWNHAGLPYTARRNWCSYTVTRTVSCHVQNGTYLQRVFQSCRWPMGCAGGSYRTIVRPTYKQAYKTVTALEWKCCPGHTGPNCETEMVSYQEAVDTAAHGSSSLRKLSVRPATYSGVKINYDKSSLIPPQMALYIGAILDATVRRFHNYTLSDNQPDHPGHSPMLPPSTFSERTLDCYHQIIYRCHSGSSAKPFTSTLALQASCPEAVFERPSKYSSSGQDNHSSMVSYLGSQQTHDTTLPL
ncbi:hypothetical protein JRQ81_007602 [Phrynocephalus forsythii]|uniref:EMI domain-containing protein n=1 Tax=Phrynocephalus forsythii TaxID=171643 RepID=A0A9Q0XC44_9SAUR|nr:hypothetical protein JRQ81_007602 [Phrynocephalus forsythii]